MQNQTASKTPTPSPQPPTINPTINPSIVLGLVGSVCAGKSTVAAELERLGAHVHRADRYVHELLERQDVADEVIAAFGPDVRGGDGRIDRKKLAEVVFTDEARLGTLEGILHPRTGARIRELTREHHRRGNKGPALVLDAALLVEAGRRAECDRLLVVDAPLARRRAWAAAQRGWTPEELDRREARLLPIAQKKQMADHVIENDGSLDELKEKVRKMFRVSGFGFRVEKPETRNPKPETRAKREKEMP